jgi:hypothetical protein
MGLASLVRHKRKQRWGKNPLVPLARAPLEAALEVEGWSRRELARELRHLGVRISPQAMARWFRAPRARCRAQTRRALSTLLGFSEEFLAGEETGGQILRAIREAVRAPDRARNELRKRLPPRNPALIDLIRHAVEAAERDGLFVTDGGKAQEKLSPANRFALHLAVLTNAPAWRSRLLPDYHPRVPVKYRRGAPSEPVDLNTLDPDLREAARLLYRAFKLILAPWLRGEADTRLDQGAIEELLRALAPAWWQCQSQ